MNLYIYLYGGNNNNNDDDTNVCISDYTLDMFIVYADLRDTKNNNECK